MFVLRRFGSETIELVEEIKTGEQDEEGRPIIYAPADGPALRKGLVLLPRHPVKATFEETFRLGVELAHEIYDVSPEHSPEFDTLVAVAQGSWFLDRFTPDPRITIAGMGAFAPIIAARGPSGHGKNRALSALRVNSYRPFYDQSTKRIPSLFRPLDTWRGALCLDECDLGKSDEASDVVHYLNCRAYGTPISRQNPDNPKESQAFTNFGLTIVTQRRAWQDDALENRTLPFLCERSQKELATTELDEWLTKGLDLQDHLLFLRIQFWDQVQIDKAERISGLKDHRLTASVLPILALRDLAPNIVQGLEVTLKVLARRRQEVRAASTHGVIVNCLWEKIDAGLVGAWNGRLFVGGEKVKDEKAEEVIVYPLQTSEIADSLKWRATDIRRVIQSLQIIPDDAPRHTIRVGSRGGLRPIFFGPAKLEVLLADFVVDYEGDALAERLAGAEGLEGVKLTDFIRPPRGVGSATTATNATNPGNVAVVADVADRSPLASPEKGAPAMTRPKEFGRQESKEESD